MRILLLLLLICGAGFLYNHYPPDKPGVPLERRISNQAPLQSGYVVMYSLSYCGVCKTMAKEMTQAGIRYVEYRIDVDSARKRELSQRLRQHQVTPGTVGVPVLFAGRQMFIGWTPISEIRSAMR